MFHLILPAVPFIITVFNINQFYKFILNELKVSSLSLLNTGKEILVHVLHP